jgi:hypothetical protein
LELYPSDRSWLRLKRLTIIQGKSRLSLSPYLNRWGGNVGEYSAELPKPALYQANHPVIRVGD